MTYQVTTPIGATQQIAVSSATQMHPLGTIIRAVDPTFGEGEFVYADGAAATIVGSAVIVDTYAGTTVLADAGDRGVVGIAMSVNLAGSFGWYQISGNAVVKVLAGLTTAKPLFLTATDGSLDDAVVAGDLVTGAVSVTAVDTPSVGFAVVALARPAVSGANA